MGVDCPPCSNKVIRERRVYYIDMVSEDLPDRALYGCRLSSLFQ
nr:MAG TPA: hypothetical protein [Caudoviricetes sp.]